MSLGNSGLKKYNRRRRGLGVAIASMLILAVPAVAAAQEFVQSGVYTGDGGPTYTVNSLNFQPDLVIVKATNTRRAFVKTPDMPDGLSKRLADSSALDTDRILTLEPNGFIVGAHAAVNEAGIEYYWVAMKSVPGVVDVGHYVGNGQPLHGVPVPGIFPDAGLVIPAGADLPVYRTTDMNFWTSYSLDGAGPQNSCIGWFNNDVFYVGNSHSVNESGQDYYYIVWHGVPEMIEFGQYPGNGLLSQDITGLSMNPEYLLIANSSSAFPVHRPASLTGDASLYFTNAPTQNNLIQAMWQGGFQVGDDNSVNNGGDDYYWLAFANAGLQADLQVEMVADDLTPGELQMVDVDITVTNNGPGDVAALQVTDVLPSGLTFQLASASRGSYNAGTGIWDIGTMSAGSFETLTLTVQVDAGTGGSTLINGASITTSDLSDPDASNNQAEVSLTVTASAGADLQVTKTVDNAIPNEDDFITYTVSLTNNGPDIATGVTVIDVLPGSLGIENITASRGTYNSGSNIWDVSTMNVGETDTLTIEVWLKPNTSGQTINNTASVATADQIDPNPSNDSASVDVSVGTVDLQVIKLVDNVSPTESATITYTVIVTNQGPSPATGVAITDPLPVGVTFQSATPSLGTYDAPSGLWTIGNMASSDTQNLTITATIDALTAGSTITNTAAVASVDQVDNNAANDSASAGITVIAFGGVDLSLDHTIDTAAPNVGDIVTYSVVVRNPGPVGATGLAVTDILPAAVDFVGALTNKGDYDEITGLWTVGDLDAGFQAALNVQAMVNTAALGTSVSHTASISAADQSDPDDTNNSADAGFVVSTSDLYVGLAVDDAAPAAGDTVTIDVMIGNSGPNPATGITVTNLLPSGLEFVSADPALGTFDAVDGLWTVGGLNPALGSVMTIEAVVLASSAGAEITNNAAITADQADPDGSNNSANVSIFVDGTDLALSLVSDTAVTEEEAEITLTLAIVNDGPQDATGIVVTQLIPSGLSLVRATPSQGNYLAVAGEWTVNDLALGDSATLELLLSVNTGTAGSAIDNLAAVTGGLPQDPNPDNDTATVSITVWTSVPSDENILWPLVGGPTSVRPGAVVTSDVLTFSYVNQGSLPDTLHSLTLSNLTVGTGTREQMDQEWQGLTVTRVDARDAFDGLLPSPVKVTFVNGRAKFDNLGWAVSAGDTMTVTVRGSASLAARDAAQLTAGIKLPGDLEFNDPYTLIGNWPLVSGQVLEVDGFVAAQAMVVEREGGLLAIGSERNLALTVELPGNGFLDDALYSFSLDNRGSAEPVTDIALVEIWADNYDLVFDAATDILLGPATFADGLWRLTGLNREIPADGRYFYATVNIAESGRPEKDIRFSLPVGNSDAVEMYSGNDGPVDVPLENPNTLGISAKDRIILTAEWFPSGVALPGAQDVPLMQFVLSNTYDDPRQLQELTVTNTSLAAGATVGQRDNICQQVTLRLDGNNNGVLDDVDVDELLGSGNFVGDKVTFSSLNLDLLPEDPDTRIETAKRLFVLVDLGLTTVADGNRVTAEIESNVDISIDHSVTVATWPLRADTEWLINGMTAAQIVTNDISVLTLGPGEGPVLAMDLTVPANGYASDELSGIEFFNEGSATASDIAIAELWSDGGDGEFDAGLNGGDDNPLGPLSLAGELWTSNILSQPVPVTGLRLFASLTVAETPQDSVTVKLGLPQNGITVVSGNDGPLDESVLGRSTLVISTSPLRTAVTFATDATNTGQSGNLNMTVRNAGSEAVTDIAPALSFVTGEGLLTVGTPTPASIATLGPGQEAAFSWSFVSSLPGEAVMEGNAQGFVNGDQVRRSIMTPTSSHRIHTPVPGLELYPTANLPFSINQGQQGLVPLNLTLRNTGDDDVANAEMTSLRLRFLETADGPVIEPADLLERIVISEGTNVYFDSDSTSVIDIGDDIELPFSESVIVTGVEPVTLGLRLDLRLNSPVPSFLISIEDADWLVANDAIDDSDVAVTYADGEFPVRTGQATLVSPATGLNVAISTLDPVNAVPGQTEILLNEINFSQSGTNDNSSSIDVGRLAFKFHDGNGDPLANPAQWFTNLSLRSAFQEHFAGLPVVESDSVVVIPLSAPVTISGTATLVLRLVGDIATDSPLGQITAVLASVDYIDARDGNMNNPVPVTLATAPEGPVLTVLGPALAVSVGGTGMMPAQVSRGTRDLTALDLTLSNPSAPGTSAATVDTIALRFFNANRQALDPGPYLDRLRIMRDGDAIGMLVDPVAADGAVLVAMAGEQLAPGVSTDLRVSLDFKPDSPTGTIEVVLGVDGIWALDAITGESLELIAAPGTSLPLSSGVATLVVPAEELSVAAVSLMPPLLAPQDESCAVFSLEFTNPASAGAGAIELSSLTLVQDVAKASDPVLGQLLTEVQLRQGDRIVARTTDLDAAATSVNLIPDSLLTVAADETVTLIAEIMVHGDAPQGPLKLMLQEDGVAAGPPGGEGLDIRILPASGRTFPFVTEIGHIGGASLSDSYANFPNPFAAGREPTTFAFSLQQEAQVNLRIMTPHGELVATILQDDSRPPGLYQNDIWQGLNGNGSPVHNGVYLAELVVKYSDGSRERILRKVAVVR